MSDQLGKIRDILGFDSPGGDSTSSDTQGMPTETFKATGDDVPLDPELEEDFEKHFTEHTFASHPLSKLVFVGLGSAVAVGALVVIYSLTQTPQEASHVSFGQTKEQDKIFDQPTSSEEDKERDELLARLALSEQNRRLEQQNKQKGGSKEPTKPVESVEKPAKPKAKPAPPPRRTSPRPTRKVRQTTRRPAPKPVTHTQPQATRPAPKPKVRRKPEVDPHKRWEELANLGSFKAKSGAAPIEEGYAPDLEDNQEGQLVASTDGVAGPFISIQSVTATVQGGVAVAGRTRREKSTVALKLEEPLLDAADNEIIPAGATIIAEVRFNNLVVTFVPATLAFEQEGQYQEIALPESGVVITGENGPLIAERREISEDEGTDWAALGQAASALGGLADLDGATEISLLLNATNRGRGYRRVQRPIEIYSVADGTQVIVRVVLPTSIPLAPTSLNGNSQLQQDLEFDFDY